jgi:HPt (histidine-containing phosphotransfer) domain-containing protein
MMQAVRAALASADAAALSRAAHRVKGSVLTFAAGPASEAALALEQLGRAGTIEGADALVGTLEAELDRLCESLKGLTEPGLKDLA